jgi:hypothetical protein
MTRIPVTPKLNSTHLPHDKAARVAIVRCGLVQTDFITAELRKRL